MHYPPAPSPLVAPVSLGGIHRARAMFAVLAWAYAGAIAVQVFLAGVAVFVGPSLIGYHRVFAALFLVVTPALLIAAFVGHVGPSKQRLALGLAGLLVLQGGWVHLAHLTGIDLFGAFHPVNALAMAIVAWRLARESLAYLRVVDERPVDAVATAPTATDRHLQPWWRSGEPIPAQSSLSTPRASAF
jgi:hypothetical protein